jgi:hypothetical protein
MVEQLNSNKFKHQAQWIQLCLRAVKKIRKDFIQDERHFPYFHDLVQFPPLMTSKVGWPYFVRDIF